MANKVLLKKSSVGARVPVVEDLEYGELAINYTDGKLYYKTASNTIDTYASISATATLTNKTLTSPVISGGTINNAIIGGTTAAAGSFTTIAASSTITATGDVLGQYLRSTNSSGDEGGEILLYKPATNSTIAGTGVTIDVFQNKLRIFEQGGTARGVYIDLTAAGAGVATNLMAAAGGTVTSITAGTGLSGGTITTSGTIAIDSTVATLTGTQTLTNKTLTGPTITLPIVNNTKQGYSTTATAAGTTILTVNSNRVQFFTGTTTQVLSLPAPQTMTLGMEFLIVNNSTGSVEVRAANAATVAIVLPGTAVSCISIDTTAGNGAAGWNAEFVGFSSVTGTGANVLATSPAITTSLTTPSTTFDLVNTTATTVNAFGAATTLNLGAATGTTTVGNQLKLSRTNSTATGTGQILLDGSNGNRIDWNTEGVSAPTFTTRSVGTKLTLYPTLSSSNVDYAIGINSGTFWNSIPGNDAGQYFKWYGGETEVASLSGTGNLIVTGSISSNGSTVVTLSGTQTLTNKSLTSPTLTGTPVAPTAAAGTSTTQVATTEFAVTEALNKAVAMAIALG
jgi:hypothetical protein